MHLGRLATLMFHQIPRILLEILVHQEHPHELTIRQRVFDLMPPLVPGPYDLHRFPLFPLLRHCHQTEPFQAAPLQARHLLQLLEDLVAQHAAEFHAAKFASRGTPFRNPQIGAAVVLQQTRTRARCHFQRERLQPWTRPAEDPHNFREVSIQDSRVRLGPTGPEVEIVELVRHLVVEEIGYADVGQLGLAVPGAALEDRPWCWPVYRVIPTAEGGEWVSEDAVGVRETEEMVGVEGGFGFRRDLAAGQKVSALAAGGGTLVGYTGIEVQVLGGGFGREDVLVYDDSYLRGERK